MGIKQPCNRKDRDFAMALWDRKVSGAFEKRVPGPKIVILQMSSASLQQLSKSEKIKINKLSGTCNYLTWLPLENEKKKMKKIELASIQIA